MNVWERFLIAVSEDPVKYAMRVLICLALALFFALVVRNAHAGPIMQGSGEGHVITLTDEPCKLEAIANLPGRATWSEPSGKVWEACYGRFGNAVVFYCSDRTIQILPQNGFRPVVGI